MRSDSRFFELLTTPQMSQADQLTIAAGVPGLFLMEQAGGAVARQALALVPEPRHVVVLCGPGNNGGDGFVAARLLAARGACVELCLFGALEQLKGDAASAARAYRGGLIPFGSLDFDAADLVIDAIFGAGLARDLDGDIKAAVQRLNQWVVKTGRPVLAVDVPTGVDGNTGAIRGAAVNATQTMTFFRRKPGHLLLPGRLQCGETIIANIGISANVLDEIKPRAFANHPGFWGKQFPVLHAAGHKYTRGHAVVLSGGLAHTGAPRLAARGALRAGAGLVTLAVPVEALAIQAMAVTAIMTTRCDSAEDLMAILKDRRKNALVLGPGLGLGEATRVVTEAVLRGESLPRREDELDRSFVLDADVLTSFAGKAHELAKAIHASGSAVVMTPHEGEFARLFGSIEESHAREWADLHDARLFQSLVQCLRNSSKAERARSAAKLSGAVIVLKGADTIVAGPDGRATIAEDLPPWLATAGSGDVLSGIIGGLLAQAMPVFEAASAAVWLHGAAARHFGRGLIAEDIPENLPAALNELQEKDFLAR